MVKGGALCVAAAVLLLSGCPQNSDGGVAKPQELFSEKKFLTNCGATKQFSESCYGCGEKECAYEGAICLHVKPEPDDPEGWVCSRQCASDEDCGLEGWSCRAIFPEPFEGASNMHCVPTAAEGGS